MKNVLLSLLLAGLVFCLPFNLVAQGTEGETTAQVPELTEFHSIIYTIWHEAWPSKDVAMLASLYPQIDSGVTTLEKATLPGILREKKDAWTEGITTLRSIATEYQTASATPSDTQRLLNAAEKLHSQYEKLVRTIRPVLKELDEFHQVLYTLYHYHMPAYDIEKIRTSVGELSAKMKTLNAASLPDRLKSKKQDFTAKRKALDKSVKQLAKVVKAKKSEQQVKDAIVAMHDRYQALESVFD
jgi:hypothetical protein